MWRGRSALASGEPARRPAGLITYSGAPPPLDGSSCRGFARAGRPARQANPAPGGSALALAGVLTARRWPHRARRWQQVRPPARLGAHPDLDLRPDRPLEIIVCPLDLAGAWRARAGRAIFKQTLAHLASKAATNGRPGAAGRPLAFRLIGFIKCARAAVAARWQTSDEFA